jgi:hypothetical protein
MRCESLPREVLFLATSPGHLIGVIPARRNPFPIIPRSEAIKQSQLISPPVVCRKTAHYAILIQQKMNWPSDFPDKGQMG